MNDQIRVELLKLASGKRVLRLEHPSSGLCLEKRLDAGTALVAETAKWCEAFVSLGARELLAD